MRAIQATPLPLHTYPKWLPYCFHNVQIWYLPNQSVKTDVSDDEAKSQDTTTMTECSFIVEAMVRAPHIHKDIFQKFWPGSFFHSIKEQSNHTPRCS